MFNGNVKIINASVTFLVKVPTEKARSNLNKTQTFKTNFKSFPNQRSDFSLLHVQKHLFMLSISFQSHLIRHSGAGRTFKDTQTVIKHLRHWESTRALRHSEGTQRALGGHLGTQRALEKHSGTQALKALGHSDT